MDENIQQLKRLAYYQANNENLPQSIQIEAMKAFALLVIAENKQDNNN